MSAFASNALAFVVHCAAFLATLGDRAIPVATTTLKLLDKADPFVAKFAPSVVPFAEAFQVALTLLVQHGPEIATDLGGVMKLLQSVETDLVPKLTPAD